MSGLWVNSSGALCIHVFDNYEINILVFVRKRFSAGEVSSPRGSDNLLYFYPSRTSGESVSKQPERDTMRKMLRHFWHNRLSSMSRF